MQTEPISWTKEDIKDVIKDYLFQNLQVKVNLSGSYIEADVYLDGDIISSTCVWND